MRRFMLIVLALGFASCNEGSSPSRDNGSGGDSYAGGGGGGPGGGSGSLVLNGEHFFSELDGGELDVDGLADGVLTVSGSISIGGEGRLWIDVADAALQVGADFRVVGNGSIQPLMPLADDGPRLTVECLGEVGLKGSARISVDGASSGGEVALCAGEQLVLRGSSTVTANGLDAGGRIDLVANAAVVVQDSAVVVQANGGAGGEIIATSCGATASGVLLHGLVEAVGADLGGGHVRAEARQSGVLLKSGATVLATGAAGDGIIELVAATTVDWTSGAVAPDPVVVENSPSEDECSCRGAVTVTAGALTATTGQVPFSVLLTAVVEADNPIALYEWDFEGDGVFDETSTVTPDASHIYDVEGTYQATIRVTDDAGNDATDSIEVIAEEGLVATLDANPLGGVRPLTVTFTPGGKSGGPSIDKFRYDWDYDGANATFDFFTLLPQPVTHTFNEEKVFTVLLEIEDEVGNTARATIDIDVVNAAPTGEVTAAPSNGPAPLDVLISVSASSPNGPITQVDIDPGDGTGIITLPGPGSTSHTYTDAGDYQMIVVVTDSVGESTTLESPLIEIDVGPPGSPTAVATASPNSGNAPLTVTLDGSGSTDDGAIVLYEWDYDYDGVTFDVDSSAATPSTSTTYTEGGRTIAGLRVTDDSGLQSIDAVAIDVNVNVVLSVLQDTVDPYLMTTSTVRTVLSAGVQSRVYIRSRGGQLVRTLFEGYRPPGTYEDVWDGRRDNASPVLDGDYYAEIAYDFDGSTFIEPDTPSGGWFSFVSESQDASNGAPINPWEDDFWELTMNTNLGNIGASEVTVWITPYFNGQDITATIFLSQVFGRGTYRSFWDGVTDAGRYITPEDDGGASGGDYLWAAKAWALPDNAIVVEGGKPTIETPMAEPNLVDPSVRRCGFDGTDIEFTLDRAASVSIAIYNTDTLQLLRVIQTGELAAGAHSVKWDGKTLSGEWAAEGPYRLDMVATAPDGNVGFLRRVLVYVTY